MLSASCAVAGSLAASRASKSLSLRQREAWTACKCWEGIADLCIEAWPCSGLREPWLAAPRLPVRPRCAALWSTARPAWRHRPAMVRLQRLCSGRDSPAGVSRMPARHCWGSLPRNHSCCHSCSQWNAPEPAVTLACCPAATAGLPRSRRRLTPVHLLAAVSSAGWHTVRNGNV